MNNTKDYKIPMMFTLVEASRATNLSEHCIRKWYIEGKIVGVRAGKKILVNMERLIEYLNTTTNQYSIQNENTGGLR